MPCSSNGHPVLVRPKLLLLNACSISVECPCVCLQYEKHAQEVRDAAIANATSDAWIMWASSFMGDGMRTGAFRNFTSLVALDSRLAWSGVIPLLRDAALLFDREVRYYVGLSVYMCVCTCVCVHCLLVGKTESTF